MKTQIGVGNKLIDRLGLITLTIILIVITISFFSEVLLLSPFYLGFILYAYSVKRKFYIYFENDSFLIENAFNIVKIDASLYREVSLSTFGGFFANYCEIAFRDGRSYKFLNDSKDVSELNRKIKNLIKPNH